MNETSLIVIGSPNTDIIASGVSEFPKPGTVTYGGKFIIGPGGKSRNIASMAGILLPPKAVAMIGKTVEDPYGLWKPPIEALEKAGVNTDYITIIAAADSDKFPSIALMAVDTAGNNQGFVIAGIGDDFSEADIDAAAPLFEAAAKNQSIFALTLECPLATALHGVTKATKLGMRVAFDPGGIVTGMDVTALLAARPFIVKPNEWEAQAITGEDITDFVSAKIAARKLQFMGAQNVLITHGDKGAYLFEGKRETHIPVPEVQGGDSKDATGCGDQAMAVLCAYLQAGKSLEVAAKVAVLAGTLQFYKTGIQPITKEELESSL